MIPSQLLAKAVDEMAKLPGIGRKTALRLCLHLLKQNEDDVNNFGESFIRMRHDLRYCKHCNNLSDTEICTICEDSHRDLSTICIVESIRDVMSIENTLQYKGLYHVLGGIISPMDGVGPSDLKIDLLIDRAQQPHVKETILALSTTMEGETTSFYLYKKLQTCQVDITTIARGVGFGDELEYTDELTLGRSIKNRQVFTL